QVVDRHVDGLRAKRRLDAVFAWNEAKREERLGRAEEGPTAHDDLLHTRGVEIGDHPRHERVSIGTLEDLTPDVLAALPPRLDDGLRAWLRECEVEARSDGEDEEDRTVNREEPPEGLRAHVVLVVLRARGPTPASSTAGSTTMYGRISAAT